MKMIKCSDPVVIPSPAVKAVRRCVLTVLLGLTMMPHSARSQSVDDLDRENGAFGHKFGELFDSFSGLKLSETSTDGRVKVLMDEHPKLDLMGFPVERIQYNFFDGRLFEIIGFLKDEDTRKMLHAAAISRYGSFLRGSDWQGGLVSLETSPNDDGTAVVRFVSIPLHRGYAQWKWPSKELPSQP